MLFCMRPNFKFPICGWMLCGIQHIRVRLVHKLWLSKTFCKMTSALYLMSTPSRLLCFWQCQNCSSHSLCLPPICMCMSAIGIACFNNKTCKLAGERSGSIETLARLLLKSQNNLHTAGIPEQCSSQLPIICCLPSSSHLVSLSHPQYSKVASWGVYTLCSVQPH